MKKTRSLALALITGTLPMLACPGHEPDFGAGTTGATGTDGTGAPEDPPSSSQPGDTTNASQPGDTTVTSPSGDTTDGPGGGSGGGTSDTEPPTTGAGDDTGDPGGPGECLDLIDYADASECMCTNCLSHIEACQADAGCVAMINCILETGCIGDCSQQCASVINSANQESKDLIHSLWLCNQAFCASPGPVEDSLCVQTGGTESTELCCNSVEDFPDTCLLGACGCAPESSHEVKTCTCPEGQCYDATSGCIAAEA